MKRARFRITTLALGAALALVPGVVFAAGGSSAPSAPNPTTPQLTPEEQAIELYNDGLGLRDKAWKLEEKAEAGVSGPEQEKLLGKVEKQFEKAAKKFARAIELKPTMFEAHSSLGYAKRRLGRYDEALVAYDRALELNPYYSEAIEYRAEAYLGLNRLGEARKAYMSLFGADRARADELFAAMKSWLEAREKDPAGVDPQELEEFQSWFEGRAELASQTAQLSPGLQGW